jgi:type I restriction enzyme S subunit
VLSITQKGIKIKDVESGEGQLATDYSKYQILNRGEFAMNHMDLLTGYVDISKYDGVTSPDYRVFQNTSPDVSDQYLLLLFQLGYNNRIFYQYGQGVSQFGRWRFPSENFNNFFIPIPLLQEQKAIADFLDEKTALIDRATGIKEKQIALLKERKQILIQNAVTKGLDPSAPMKDSGVDWIGQIPTHWEVKKAFHYFKATKGQNAAQLTKEFCGTIPGPYPVYSGQTDNEGVLGKIDRSEFDFTDTGCVLCSTVGAKAMTLRYLKTKFSLSQNCMILTARTEHTLMKFYSYAFVPMFAFFRSLIPDHMQASFRMEDFYNFRFLLVPEHEQVEILNHIDKKCEGLDEGISIIQTQIEKLKEYKASLINSAVTGKIKVA